MLSTQYFDAISKLYVTYFNRPADVLGHEYWQTVAVNNGGNLNAIADQFAQSQEFLNMYAGHDATAIVNRTYAFLFNHPADASGLQFWSSAINEGRVTLGNVVKEIANAAQGQDYRALELKTWAASAFTSEVHKQEEIGRPYGGDFYDSPAEANAARVWLSYIWDENSFTATMQPNLRDAVLNIFEVDGQARVTQNFSPTAFDDSLSVVFSDDYNSSDTSSDAAPESHLTAPHPEVTIVGTPEFSDPMM